MNSAARKIQQAFRQTRQGLGFTNTSGDGYRLTKPVVTARTVTLFVPWAAFKMPSALPADFVSVEGRQLIGNPASCRLTRSHGLVGTPAGVAHWNFRLRGGGSAAFHKTGAMQITTSGRATYEPVLRKVAKHFLSSNVRVNVNNVKLVKLDGRIHVNRTISLDTLARNIPRSLATVSNEPELFTSGVFVHWKSPAVTLVFFSNGTILIRGTKNLDEVPAVIHRIIEVSGRPFSGMMLAKVPVAARHDKEAQRLAKLNARYPRAPSYSAVREGKYVRPGPNGLPRFYPIVANMTLVRPKALRAYKETGVNIPPAVYRQLGLNAFEANMAELMNSNVPVPNVGAKKSPPRRAPNWNANRPGYYVRPGTGKQPYFYKIPKGIAAGRKTVLKAYTEAGVPVPQRVRNIFGIAANTGGASGSRKTYVVNGNRIDGKQYSRYTVKQLIQIARNMNIAGASENFSAAQIFGMIKKKAGPSPVRSAAGPNVTLNGRHYTFRNNASIERNGRSRVFNTLPKAERLAIARAYLNNAAYANFQTKKSKNWYPTLKSAKAAKASPTSSINSNYIRELENALRS